jgi:hypothetical protein
MFNVWTGNYPRPPSNSVAHLNAVYNNEYVLTRDELPSFYRWVLGSALPGARADSTLFRLRA